MNPLSNDQGSVALTIFNIPDLDVRSRISQVLHDLRHMFVGGSMHDGFRVVIHCVNVPSQLQCQLNRFEYFNPGSRILSSAASS